MRICLIELWPTVHRLRHMFLHLDIQNIWHHISVIFYKALRRWYSHVLPPGRYLHDKRSPWGTKEVLHAFSCVHTTSHIVLAVPFYLEQMIFCSISFSWPSLIQTFHNRYLALAQQYCCYLRKKNSPPTFFPRICHVALLKPYRSIQSERRWLGVIQLPTGNPLKTKT